MLQKIKEFLISIKGFMLYILGPLISIGAYIYYLKYKVSDLQDQLSQSKADKYLANTLEQKVEKEHEAIQSESDYATLRSQYLSQSGDSGDKPNT